MKKVLMITGTAIAAMQGIAHAEASNGHAALLSLAMKDLSYAVSMAVPVNTVNAVNVFASHASHSSHSSHSSHYSGSGGSYQSPSYSAPKAPPTLPPASVNDPYTAPKPAGNQLKIIIMRVQAALYSKGYDPGAIDGTLGAATKQALREFQTAHGLPASAKMTTATLNALGVSLSP